VSGAGQHWDNLNYFNYFTEVEEHFQRARGTGLFLLSSLDWALIETWKNAGVPLEAVLRGVDEAFEAWRAKKSRTRMVNSLAYCTQEVMGVAQRLGGEPSQARMPVPQEPFCSLEELKAFLRKNADALAGPYGGVCEALEKLLAEIETHYQDLESLEQRLTVLESKMIAIARSRQSDDEMLEARRELDTLLRPYRGKMTADQLKMLHDQFLDRRLLETAGLPRLSLFYLR
jgi:hypothetical protein